MFDFNNNLYERDGELFSGKIVKEGSVPKFSETLVGNIRDDIIPHSPIRTVTDMGGTPIGRVQNINGTPFFERRI